MAAGALFRNEAGALLLVNPTYKESWEIPGGAVEANESPRQACVREVWEELKLEISPHRLLSVSYRPESDQATESLTFIFYGGVLGVEEIVKIQLPENELSEYRFVQPTKIDSFLVNKRAIWRIRKSLEVWDTEQTLYLEP